VTITNEKQAEVKQDGCQTGPDRNQVNHIISNERYAQKTSPGFLDVAPDLVVEILSPNDSWIEVTQKLREYFAIGVRLVWVVNPQTHSVYAYRALTDVREFTENDNLPGDDVLPGFLVKVAQLFEE